MKIVSINNTEIIIDNEMLEKYDLRFIKYFKCVSLIAMLDNEIITVNIDDFQSDHLKNSLKAMNIKYSEKY